jgi:MFS family permease
VENAQNHSFRSLILPFYLPAAFVFTGLGMLIPILPLYAKDLGASVAAASFIVGLYGFGNLLFNIPAGLIDSRFNKRKVSLIAISLAVLFVVLPAMVSSVGFLGLCMLLFGAARTTFFLIRLSYFRHIIPARFRARRLAIIAGEYRLGNFIGPIVGGYTAAHFGFERTLFLAALFFFLGFVVMYLWLPSMQSRTECPESSDASVTGLPSMGRIGEVIKENGRVFASAGTAIIVLQLMRTGRQVLVPLLGDAKGLDASQIGLIVGLTFLFELLIFYPAAMVLDRWGRKVVSVPCMIFFSLGLGLFPLAGGFVGITLASMVTGLGNGIGSGLNMTLSTDFAPRSRPGEFLGVWRFIVDFGTSGGPFVVGAVAGVLSLGAASLAVAALGFAGAGIMYFFVPESLKKE